MNLVVALAVSLAPSFADENQITVKVVDSKGKPVPNASVWANSPDDTDRREATRGKIAGTWLLKIPVEWGAATIEATAKDKEGNPIEYSFSVTLTLQERFVDAGPPGRQTVPAARICNYLSHQMPCDPCCVPADYCCVPSAPPLICLKVKRPGGGNRVAIPEKLTWKPLATLERTPRESDLQTIRLVRIPAYRPIIQPGGDSIATRGN